ncbi:MAG: iron ABC transporter permease [Eubacteriales bacterium]|nr:iron ABC transporter permease [Eubacteriales bacterium]
MKNKKIVIAGIAAVAAVLLCAVISIACGVKSVGVRSMIGAFIENGAPALEVSIVRARIPRTVFGLIAGAALSVSGLLMQSITRNPIADPSILGVNTGASLFVVCGIAFGHISNGNQYIMLAFVGAFLTAVLVYGLASVGKGGATPIRLALSGAAAGTALQSLVNTVMLPDSHVMDQFRFWQTGSIGGASWSDIRIISPYLLIGFVLAVYLIPSLNILALGDETATGLGVNVTRIRVLAALAGVLLCAAVTALAGPIGFVGLMVPHLMRAVLGPDLKKLLPFSAAGGACMLVLSDVAGRILGRPGELESGIITALIGGPVFIMIIRKVKVRSI